MKNHPYLRWKINRIYDEINRIYDTISPTVNSQLRGLNTTSPGYIRFTQISCVFDMNVLLQTSSGETRAAADVRRHRRRHRRSRKRWSAVQCLPRSQVKSVIDRDHRPSDWGKFFLFLIKTIRVILIKRYGWLLFSYGWFLSNDTVDFENHTVDY